jgi:hypothetical protein
MENSNSAPRSFHNAAVVAGHDAEAILLCRRFVLVNLSLVG